MDYSENTGASLLARVREALVSKSITDAEYILSEAINCDRRDVNAWWLWAIIARTPEEQRLYIRQVLRLDPDHQQARAALDILKLSDRDSAVYMDRLRQTILSPEISESTIDPQGKNGNHTQLISKDRSHSTLTNGGSSTNILTQTTHPHVPTSSQPLPMMTDEVADQEPSSTIRLEAAQPSPTELKPKGSELESSLSSTNTTDLTTNVDLEPIDEPNQSVSVSSSPELEDIGSHFINTTITSGTKQHQASPLAPHSEVNNQKSRDKLSQSKTPDLNSYPSHIDADGTAIMTPVQPFWKQGVRILDGAGTENNILPIALAYLVAITLAEVFTVFITVRVGVLMHMGILLLLLFHTVRRIESPDHRLWASLSLVPLIRIISLSLPLSSFTLFYWFLFTSIPLFAATFLVMRLLSMSWDYVGVNLRAIPMQLLISLLGFALGYIEYLILKPAPLIDELTLVKFWWPALIIMVSTGFLEELLFRGVLQGTAVEFLGRVRGIIYVAVFFGVLHIGYKSLIDVIFVTAVGLVFGWLVMKTKSIIGVTIAHGITNIMLFLIMPFVANGSVALPF